MTKLVWLDAGHGGKDSGAVGNGLYEKNITLALALRVRDILLDNYNGVAVKMTRTTDVFYELSERAKMANNANADFFFSIHVNAGGGTGYEDFIYNKPQAASIANQKTIHAKVVPVLTKYNIRNRGMKQANFAVVRETKMPAMLVETLFIDNANDAALLKNVSFLEDIAQAYANGIAEVVGATKKTTTTTTKPATNTNTNTKVIYRVQVGAFSQKANADALAAKIKAKGFDAIVKLVGNLYKVQVGAYSVKANAEAQKAKLEKAGFGAFITTN